MPESGSFAKIVCVFAPGNTSKSASTSHTVTFFSGACIDSQNYTVNGENHSQKRTVPFMKYAREIFTTHDDCVHMVVCCMHHSLSANTGAA